MAKNPKQNDASEQRLTGFHAVQSVIRRNPQDVITLWVDERVHTPRMKSLLSLATESGVTINRVERKELDALAVKKQHQGVIADCMVSTNTKATDLHELLDSLETDPFLLILDQVQDPHNLGACIRTAEGAGVDAVIVPKDGAAPVNETVRRVAAGAAERVPVYYVTNLVRCIESLKERGIWVFGTSDSADDDLYQGDLSGPIALVLGAEGTGIRRLTHEACDRVFQIPMEGTVSSLNVSVTAGVVLFEAKRQRTLK